jgi:hypothetical protein
VKEHKWIEDNVMELWWNTSNKESGTVDALKRASSTVVETYNNTHFIRHPNTKDRQQTKEKERKSTWGEPKKTRDFFFEQELREEEVAVLKQQKRRSISEEFIPHSLSFSTATPTEVLLLLCWDYCTVRHGLSATLLMLKL